MSKKIDYLIPISIVIFSIFIAYYNIGSGIINYSDHKFPFDFYKLFSHQIYTWNDYIYLWFNQSLSLMLNLGYTGLFSLIQSAIPDYIIINRLEYIIAIFCNIYFAYLFLTTIFKKTLDHWNKISLMLCASFFTTNILTASLYFAGIPQQLLAFSFIPLTLFSIRKYLSTGNYPYLFLLIPSWIFISSFNLPYGFIAIAAVMLIILSFNDLTKYIKIKLILAFITWFVLLNSYWLLPFGYSTFISPSDSFFSTLKSKNTTDDLIDHLNLTSSRYSIDQLFKFSLNFNLIKIQNADTSAYVWYLASNFIVIVSYLALMALLWYSLFYKKNQKNLQVSTLALITIFILFLFLSKGRNNPFPDLYPFLMEQSTFFKIFRDSFKWMIIPYLVFVILASNILINGKSKIIKGSLILFLLSYLFPWTHNGLMEKLRAYDVPGYYFELSDAYREMSWASNKRAVILDSYVGPTSYQFDTRNVQPFSSNILKFISPLPIVDLFSNGGGLAFDYLKDFYSNLKKTDDDISAFQKIWATHIYQQKDIKNPSEYTYTDKYFNKSTFGKLDIYEIKEEFALPKIYLSNVASEKTETVFSKINPTKYSIKINNLREKADLNFLYTFDSNWLLFLDKPRVSNCVFMKTNKLTEDNNPYTESNSPNNKECLTKEVFFQGNELGYLFKGGLFVSQHVLLNNLFNKWTVDAAHIRNNFDASYYTQNPDGSIDVELTLYFRPQSYFYLGLIISGTTLVVLIGYLGYDFIRRRRKDQKAILSSTKTE